MNTAAVEREGVLPDRASVQRDRILHAARQCFIDHGFHSASMSSIADAAGMSAGLIYRYFESKNAIILAIIERQLQEKRADIASLQPGADFAQRVGQVVSRWRACDQHAMNPALFLEMSALGSRDPQIGNALRDADLVTRADFAAWLVQRSAEAGRTLEQDQAMARSFALQCLIEGLALRVVREPDMSDDMVAAALALVLPGLLS